jgi:peptide/nickel transport system substrate-binding protein
MLMPNSKRLAAIVAGAAVTILLMSSSLGSAAGTTTGASGSLVVNMAVAPGTLDPSTACNFTDFSVIDQVYAGLVQFGTQKGPAGTTKFKPTVVLPYVASSWKISNGGKTYTFAIRKGIRFPSGRPLNAAAVKYSYERAITMGSCANAAVEDLSADLVKSITAPSAYSLVVNLRRPDPEFLLDLAYPGTAIVDPPIVQAHGGVKQGQINEWMASHVAGVGPFLLQSYQPNQQAVLVANPKWFDPPASKKIVINYISSDPTLLLQARSGAADVTVGLTKQSVHSLASNKNLRVVSNSGAVSEQIGFLNTMAPFDNVKFRTALTWAVPYQQILKNVVFGYGALFYGPIPPVMPNYNPTLEKPRSLNLGKAQQLIKQSGVQTPVNMTMSIVAGAGIDRDIATIVQGIWRQLGVNVTIQTLSPSDYLNGLQNHTLQSWIRLDGPFLVNPAFYLSYDMKCGFSHNNTAMCIPAADALLAKARVARQPNKLQPIWDQIIKLWNAASPKIPLYADTDTTLLNKRMKHYYYANSPDFRTWAK